MSQTVTQIFDKVLALLNKYSEEGVRIAAADTVDMQMKSIPLCDMAQKELFKIGKLYNTYEFDNKPATNLLGQTSNFNAVDYPTVVNGVITETSQYYPNETGVAGARAYYFEVNRDTAVVTIEENQSGVWTTLVTPTITASISTYTGFRGVITPLSSTNNIRMKFSGTTHYRHINRALFSTPFAASDVPEYAPWYTKTMPANFRLYDAIIEEIPERQYVNSINHKKEGFKTLKINYFFEGKFRVIYKPVPTDITAITDVLEIDDITAQAVVFYVASFLSPFKKKELTQFYLDKFAELKAENSQDAPISTSDIIDVYSSGGGGF